MVNQSHLHRKDDYARAVYHGLFSLVVCFGVGVFDKIAPKGFAAGVVLVVSTARILVRLALGGGESEGASFVDARVADRPFLSEDARLTSSFFTPTFSSGLKCCFLTGSLAVGSIWRLWLPVDVASPAAEVLPLLDLLLLPFFGTRAELDLDEGSEAGAPILVERPAVQALFGMIDFDLNWSGDGSLFVLGNGSLVVLLAVVGLALRPGDAATLAREDEVGLWICFIPGSSLSDDNEELNTAGNSPRLLLPCF